MRLVLDACVLVKLLIPEVDSERAAQLFDRCTALAPDFAVIECSQVLWKKWRQGFLSEDECRGRFEVLTRLELEEHVTLPLLPLAQELAIALNHDVYDCLYLALAEAEDCQVVTCDRALVGAAEAAGLGGRVKLLGIQN